MIPESDIKYAQTGDQPTRVANAFLSVDTVTPNTSGISQGSRGDPNCHMTCRPLGRLPVTCPRLAGSVLPDRGYDCGYGVSLVH